jgi:hypothetical protein
MLNRLKKMTGFTAGRKAFVVGEIGIIMPDYLERVFRVRHRLRLRKLPC